MSITIYRIPAINIKLYVHDGGGVSYELACGYMRDVVDTVVNMYPMYKQSGHLKTYRNVSEDDMKLATTGADGLSNQVKLFVLGERRDVDCILSVIVHNFGVAYVILSNLALDEVW